VGTRLLLGAATAVVAIVGFCTAGMAKATTLAPQALVVESEHALAAVGSFTLNGFFIQGRSRVGLLLRSSEHGTAAAGTLTSTTKSGAGFVGEVSFVRIGSALYLKGNQPFWASSTGSLPKVVLKLLGGQWIQLPSSEVKTLAGALGVFTNPSRLATSLLGAASSKGLAIGPPTSIAGEPVLSVEGGGGVLYVARNGDHLPVEIVGTGASRGSFRFGYPRTMAIKAPAGAKTLSQVVKAAAGGSRATGVGWRGLE
jgi:hypothetical protein